MTAALVAFREHADELLAPNEEARVEVRHDEYAVDVELRYRGVAPALPGEADTAGGLAERDPDAAAAWFRLLMPGRLADRVRAEQQGGEASLRLHFEH